MRQHTGRPQSRQAYSSRPLTINYRGLDGVGHVTIPPELVGHPLLLPLIPPDTIVRLQALIDTVDYYNAAKKRLIGETELV